jgi:hypothetical protein
VKKELQKAQAAHYFIDIDWANAFHQVRLAEQTSLLLSIQTPWGQFRPLFMPEGIGPASGILQAIVAQLFADFSDFVIAIFDNLLVLCDSYPDAYSKMDRILDRCIERNVFLKLSKSYLGFRTAKFFGYICSHGRYELSDDRKAAIRAIPFPSTQKQLQSFLGAALFFHDFIPHYSSLVAPLTDMLKNSFDWSSPSAITSDHRTAFEQVKERLQDACAIYLPDYSLDWILRTDASTLGVGAVLLQRSRLEDGSPAALQPIGFCSQRFSPQAQRWTTIEQEAYAIYFAVNHFSYYLRCKPFVLETDHNNLLWIEASAVPKVIRWRVYLQSFSFLLRHIPGKTNLVADWLSRSHQADVPPTATEDPVLASLELNMIPFMDLNLVPHDPARSFTASPLDDHPILDPSDPVDDVPPAFVVVNPSRSTSLPADPSSAPIGSDLPTDVLPAAATTAAADPDTLVNPSDPAAPAQADLPPVRASDLYGDPNELLRQVHGGRLGHFGARRTWLKLNKLFPGHHIPYRVVADFVATCPVCQKTRLGMLDFILPVTRHLKPPHHRAMVGVDTLTITPVDKHGNTVITVVVNMFTKLTALYPSPRHDAINTATALFQYVCTYGLFDALYCDPGTEFWNAVVTHLTGWLGIRQVISLVDRHESNGVENTNGRIVRHLSALVADERVADRWSSPTVLPLIQFILNSSDNSDAGVIPFHAHFGSEAISYFQLPASGSIAQATDAYIRQLDADLKILRDLSKQHQDTLVIRRGANPDLSRQNTYQPGDLVLWQLNPDEPRPTKLSPKYVGPYSVIQQHKNDVTAKHIILGHIKYFHVTRLKIFHGTLEEAKAVAMLDCNQYLIDKILAYAGDPLLRSSVDFHVRFADGTLLWLPYSNDISTTTAFEDFCRSNPACYMLLFDASTAKKLAAELNRSPIVEVQPGTSAFVDIRSYGAGWYATLPLPDLHSCTYVVEYKFTAWKNNRHLKIIAHCPVFNEDWTLDHLFIKMYAHRTTLDPADSSVRLVDATLLAQYPELLPT